MSEDIKLIGTVEDVFQITGRGALLCLSLGTEEFDWSIGTKIKIIKSDGEILKTKICGRNWQRSQDILIEKKIKKEEVPIGSKVLLDE
jgi:hypothetical protein